jgi:hypothetical protein
MPLPISPRFAAKNLSLQQEAFAPIISAIGVPGCRSKVTVEQSKPRPMLSRAASDTTPGNAP